MNLPFTKLQFLNLFTEYNTSIWPLHIGFYLMGILAVAVIIRGSRYSGRIVSAILSVMWLWMGFAYHIVYFSQINKAAFAFGALFILQGIFFAAITVSKKNTLSLSPSWGSEGVGGYLLIIFALLVYPVIGILSGHGYPQAPLFGVAPCPTTIFTFGILLWSNKKLPVYLIVIPFIWSLIGATASVSLGITEDVGLLISGLAGVVLIVLKNRALRLTQTADLVCD